MTAQYKPYKDQEDFDDDQNDENWGDRGSVEIFDKSPIPRSQRTKYFVAGIAITVIAVILGFTIGYFGHTHHSNCKYKWSVALHSVMEADPTIRKKIMDEINEDNIKLITGHMTRTTRLAGIKESEEIVRFLQRKWRSYGLQTEVKAYEVLLNHAQFGKPNRVEIIKDNATFYSAKSIDIKGHEVRHVLEMDPIAAYSKSGEVIAEPMYGEYCFADTLKRLQETHNVSIKGKILICRQLKDNIVERAVRAAETAGAVGVLFYMDPKDVGLVPSKSHIPGDAVGMTNARLTTELYGDPLTPGFPSLNYTYRIDQNNLRLPKILVQPISADDAYNILKFMGGVRALQAWAGGFNITYNIGPGFKAKDMRLRMVINNVYKNATIRNLIGVIKGSVEPDRYVIIGGHHDAWRFGAIDNAGGVAVVTELARVFGKLVKDGWVPRRTIIFASWDANCFGRIGSTEWVEENFKILKDRAIAYLNVDSVVTGTDAISVSGSTLLMNAAFNATQEVKVPSESGTEKTVYDQWLKYNGHTRDIDSMIFSLYADFHLKAIAAGKHSGAGLLMAYLRSTTSPRIPHFGNLDTVSDWQPFMKNVGVPVLGISYRGQPKAHIIHRYDTKYDTYGNLVRLDPTFKYHKAVAQVYGEILRNLADNLFIPFNLLNYAQFVHERFLYQAINERLKWQRHGINIDILTETLKNFTNAALMVHIKQELSVLSDPMSIRRINDQLLLLERTFLEVGFLPKDSITRAVNVAMSNISNWHSLQDNAFLSDITSSGMNGLLTTLAYRPFASDWDLFRIYYSVVIATLQAATKALLPNDFGDNSSDNPAV